MEKKKITVDELKGLIPIFLKEHKDESFTVSKLKCLMEERYGVGINYQLFLGVVQTLAAFGVVNVKDYTSFRLVEAKHD